MRFRWFILAAMFGTALVSSTAHAVSNSDYISIRNQTALATLENTSNIKDQFSSLAGQVIELEGTVNGTFSSDSFSGYILNVAPNQFLIVSAPNDTDIAVGKTLRVLARVPAQGAMLESLSVTQDGTELAQVDLANLRQDIPSYYTLAPDTGIEIIPDEQPRFQYNDAPALKPVQPVLLQKEEPEEEPKPAAVTEDLLLAQQPEIVAIYAKRIQNVNGNISNDLAQKIAYNLLKESEEHGVDPRLVFAMVTQESRFSPTAVSPAGAQGLGQLMPGTAAGLGVSDPFDVQQNLCGTVRYIAGQLDQFGRLSLALAAYNAGPGNVRKYGGVPPFRETQNYVKNIWRHYAQLAGLDPETGAQIASR